MSRFEVFADAIGRVAAGDAVIEPDMVSQLLAVRGAFDPVAALSPRTSEVPELMARGRTIAALRRAGGQLGRRGKSDKFHLREAGDTPIGD